MSTIDTTTGQAANADSGVQPAQGSIASTGASGNIAGNDAAGLTMDFDKIDAFMFGGGTLEVSASSVEPGANQSTPAPAAEPAPVVVPPGEQTPAPVTAPQEPATPAVPAEGTTATTTTAQPTPPAAPEPSGAPAGDRIVPARIGTGQFSESTQRAMRLMHELNAGRTEGTPGTITIAEALQMVQSADSGQTITATPVAAPEQVPAAPSPAETLRTEVEALETQIREAGENQVLFNGDLARATIELTDKKARLAALEATEAQSQQARIQQHVAAREAVKQQVVSEYRGAEDPKTPLGARVAALVQELQNPSHPDHARINQVDAPRYVVERAAGEVAETIAQQFGLDRTQVLNGLRVTPAAPPVEQVTTPAQPLPVAGNRPVVVASGSTGVGGATAPPSEAQILASALSNPDAIDSLLGYGTSFRIGG